MYTFTINRFHSHHYNNLASLVLIILFKILISREKTGYTTVQIPTTQILRKKKFVRPNLKKYIFKIKKRF